MNSLRDKRFYKVISLFIKALILIAAFCFISLKLRDESAAFSPTLLSSVKPLTLIVLLSLMLVNWALEAIKWKILIAPLEPISFGLSFSSVLAGVTASIFTPNRIGEFTGRVFGLRSADRIEATMLSLVGSGVQLLVTVAGGAAGYYVLQEKYYGFFDNTPFGWSGITPGLLTGAIVIALIAAFFFLPGLRANGKFNRVLAHARSVGRSAMSAVITLSVLRYLVFSLQYFIVLRMLGVNAGPTILVCLIFLTFFVTSAVPTFATTEIAVRSATAVFFFGLISSDAGAIVASSLALWMINLALPAIAGAFFIWRLRFFPGDDGD